MKSKKTMILFLIFQLPFFGGIYAGETSGNDTQGEFREAGHSIKEGFKATGRGIKKGAKKTGRSFKKAGKAFKNEITQ